VVDEFAHLKENEKRGRDEIRKSQITWFPIYLRRFPLIYNGPKAVIKFKRRAHVAPVQITLTGGIGWRYSRESLRINLCGILTVTSWRWRRLFNLAAH
jgi:hypothetical protein